MKNFILPFLFGVILSFSSCDDPSVSQLTSKDTTDNVKSSITEDIIFVDTEKDSAGANQSFLYGINVDGSGRRKIRKIPDNVQRYELSPDKKKILVGAVNDIKSSDIKSLSILSVDTNTIEQIFPADSYRSFFYFKWLPNSKDFIYSDGGNLYKTDGSTKLLLANNLYYSGYPAKPILSSDGTIIYYLYQKGLYSINSVDRSEKILYPYSEKAIQSYRFSSDQTKIAFTIMGQSGYYIMNKDGSNVRFIDLSFLVGSQSGGGTLTSSSIVDWSADDKYFILSFGFTFPSNNPKMPGKSTSTIVISSPTETDFTKFKINKAGYWSPHNAHLLFSNANEIHILDTYTGTSRMLTSGFAPIWVRK